MSRRLLLWVAFACLAATALSAQLSLGRQNVRIRRRVCNTDADCNSRGTCTDGSCSCSTGYGGVRCAKVCPGTSFHQNGTANVVCSGHGSCIAQLAGRCRCVTGYTGSDCGTALPVPETPSSVSAGTTTNDSVSLSWSAPSNEGQDGLATFTGTEYTVEACESSLGCDDSQSQSLDMSTGVQAVMRSARLRAGMLGNLPSTLSSSNWVVVCVTTQTTCTVSNLKEGTAYKVRVRAKFHKSDFSQPVVFDVSTTARAPDYETRSPIVNGSVTATSIGVVFVPPADIGGGAQHAKVTHYVAQYRKVGDSAWTSTSEIAVAESGDTTVTLSGLDVFSEYEVRQLARNVAGLSDASPAVTQKTRGQCGNGNVESGSLGNGLTYSEACDGGFCCTDSCQLESASACSGHGTCTNGTTCSCTGGYLGTTCSTTGTNGAGSDGTLTLSSGTWNVHSSKSSGRSVADGVSYAVASITASSITAAAPAAGIATGDKVLLVFAQADGDTANVGNYDVLDVASVSGSTITVTADSITTSRYDFGGSKRLVVQRIPQYSSVSVSGTGKITASPYATDGSSTGIVAFMASASLSVSNNGIVADELGFPGGVAGSSGPADAKHFEITSGGANGGSGATHSSGGAGGGSGSGGAGGSGAYSGGAGGRGGGGGTSSNDQNGVGNEGSGSGGAAPYSSGGAFGGATKLVLGGGAAAGGGGGAGGTGANYSPQFQGGKASGLGGVGSSYWFSSGGNGTNGARGGGAVFIRAASVSGSGSVSAKGGKGGSGGGGGGATGYDGSGGGGGGAGADGSAGGSIVIEASESTVSLTADVTGGNGGGGGGGGGGDGGGGGGGGGGGIGGGGGGGGYRTAQIGATSISARSSNGGSGGQQGYDGDQPNSSNDRSGGLGGSVNGGGGNAGISRASRAAANAGGSPSIGTGNSAGSAGSGTENGGSGGKGGNANAIHGGGGGGGQAGNQGPSGYARLSGI